MMYETPHYWMGNVAFARFTADEKKAVKVIIDRAVALMPRPRGDRTRRDYEMDLSAVHARFGLRLVDLSKASDTDLVHDILGIGVHLDRTNGELKDFFEPRFSKREEV